MTETTDNPLLRPWETPFGLPPFDAIRPEHFAPAFDHAMRSHRAEIDAIATSPEPATFDNTLAALDRGGRELTRISQVFFNLAASETSPALQAVEREMSPRLAAHYSAIHLDARLFSRIDAVMQRRAELALTPEQSRLVERIHLDFVRAGARLSGAARTRYAAIEERLATLTTRFSQNVLADEASFRLVLKDERDLAGLPGDLRAAAREAAHERGEPDVWMITLSRSLVAPFLTFSDRRDLRQQVFDAWNRRGEHDGEHDNRPVAREILALRNEQARLHGYRHYADYALADRMAGTPEAVARLFEQIWEPAKVRAAEERDALREVAAAEGATHAIEPWDWRYYARRSARRDIGWTTRRSSRIFRSSGCWPRPSIRRTGCSESVLSSARICTPITPMFASSKCTAERMATG